MTRKEEEATAEEDETDSIKATIRKLLRMEGVAKEDRGRVGFLYVVPDGTNGSIEGVPAKKKGVFDTSLIDWFGQCHMAVKHQELVRLLIPREEEEEKA